MLTVVKCYLCLYFVNTHWECVQNFIQVLKHGVDGEMYLPCQNWWILCKDVGQILGSFINIGPLMAQCSENLTPHMRQTSRMWEEGGGTKANLRAH